MFHLICLATLLMTAGSTEIRVAHAQVPSAQVEFDVASVRPNQDSGRALLQATPGRLTTTDMPLQRLWLIACDVQDYQVVGEPPWIASDRYDVMAIANSDATVQRMEGPMLQALLEQRFKVKLHRETRLLPLYELTIAKGGPRLRPSAGGTCSALREGCSTYSRRNFRRSLGASLRPPTVDGRAQPHARWKGCQLG